MYTGYSELLLTCTECSDLCLCTPGIQHCYWHVQGVRICVSAHQVFSITIDMYRVFGFVSVNTRYSASLLTCTGCSDLCQCKSGIQHCYWHVQDVRICVSAHQVFSIATDMYRVFGFVSVHNWYSASLLTCTGCSDLCQCTSGIQHCYWHVQDVRICVGAHQVFSIATDMYRLFGFVSVHTRYSELLLTCTGVRICVGAHQVFSIAIDMYSMSANACRIFNIVIGIHRVFKFTPVDNSLQVLCVKFVAVHK
jgi:predicted GNAT family N-acyltransferase